jgi:hypothetical protein
MRERETVNLRDMAAAYTLAYPVATVASARVFLREHGLEATEYRESRLLWYLHHKHGWRLDRSLCRAALHRAPESTVEDCLKFCTRWEIPLRSVEGEVQIEHSRSASSKRAPTYKGVPDLLAYVKRAAEKCGVVKGFQWYYHELPF